MTPERLSPRFRGLFPTPSALNGTSANCQDISLTPAPWRSCTTKEDGSEYVERILREPGSRSLISRLSIVEMESVLALKMGTGELNQGDVEIARRCLRADLSQQRVTVGPPIWGRHYQEARALLVRYGVAEGLRTLDALQFGSRPGSTAVRAHRSDGSGRPQTLPGRSTFRLPGGEPGETRRTPGVMSSSLGIGVDLRTPNELSRYFRDQVLASAAVQYERE